MSDEARIGAESPEGGSGRARPEGRARAARLSRRLDDLQLPSEDDEGSYEDEEP